MAEKRLEGQASLPDSVAPTLTVVSDQSSHSQVPNERLTWHQATPSLILEEAGVGWGGAGTASSLKQKPQPLALSRGQLSLLLKTLNTST